MDHSIDSNVSTEVVTHEILESTPNEVVVKDPVVARLERLKARIDKTRCPKDARFLIHQLARFFDPEAIALLIALLAHDDERAEYAARALARFGEAAEASLREVIAARGKDDLQRFHAEIALEELELRIRLEQVVGH
jgi:HEAT repeat protein